MEQEIRRKAEERVERRIGFFTHLVTYLIINLGFIVVWYFTSDKGKGFPWFVIILAGWGIGLLAHLFSVFVFDRFRERMVDKEMNKLRQKRGNK